MLTETLFINGSDRETIKRNFYRITRRFNNSASKFKCSGMDIQFTDGDDIEMIDFYFEDIDENLEHNEYQSKQNLWQQEMTKRELRYILELLSDHYNATNRKHPTTELQLGELACIERIKQKIKKCL